MKNKFLSILILLITNNIIAQNYIIIGDTVNNHRIKTNYVGSHYGLDIDSNGTTDFVIKGFFETMTISQYCIVTKHDVEITFTNNNNYVSMKDYLFPVPKQLGDTLYKNDSIWSNQNMGLYGYFVASVPVNCMNTQQTLGAWANITGYLGLRLCGLSDTVLGWAKLSFYNYLDTIFSLTEYASSGKIPASTEQYNLENDIINVYPNPATEKIIIDAIPWRKDDVIYIYNIQGQLLIMQSFQQSETDIDISGLAKGIYILKFSNINKTVMTKIVKE
ncbi:MAG: T9SS type A sorting domain-containing protein [Bacteroidetes bacterium]|nr:T9SS type A sorting domain-containing protein [Bacteroidota bacterium]